jgi:hypothetical protein
MKKIAIHQPNYFPWPGYFYKMLNADIFVLYDNIQIEQYSQQAFVNRTKIRTAEGQQWMTCPVHVNGSKLIKDVVLADDINWRTKHLKSIYYSYNSCRYYDEIYPQIEQLILFNDSFLADFNERIIRWVCNYLDINCQILRASDMDLKAFGATERLIEIVQYLDGDAYLSGMGARTYQNDNLFIENNIKLIYSKFVCKPYLQRYQPFMPLLSVLDVLFNMGKESRELIES